MHWAFMQQSSQFRQDGHRDMGLLSRSYVACRSWGHGRIALVNIWSGAGVRTNVEEAYKYLMGHYEPGDRVLYLFGYSRGAHTVRVLAGMLHKCGLLTKGSNNLVPYATKIYKEEENGVAAGFKGSFSRECKPYFIGVWAEGASWSAAAPAELGLQSKRGQTSVLVRSGHPVGKGRTRPVGTTDSRGNC